MSKSASTSSWPHQREQLLTFPGAAVSQLRKDGLVLQDDVGGALVVRRQQLHRALDIPVQDRLDDRSVLVADRA